MKLTEKDKKMLEVLAKSDAGVWLKGYFEKIKSEVADIRNNPNLSNDIRIGVIEVLDTTFINHLKTLSGEPSSPDENEWQ